MTGNQIRFNEYRETKRHNKVSEIHEHRKVGAEEEKARAATTTAETGRLGYAESARHNREQERVNWWSAVNNLAETAQHNRATEGLGWYTAETGRLNADIARLKSDRDYEIGKRQASVSERQAKVSEDSVSVARQNAETARRNVQLGQAQLSEVTRHNKQAEAETVRSNKVNALNDLSRVWTTRSYNTVMGDVAQRNADTNRYSAASGSIKDETAIRQAAASEQQAEAASRQAGVKESMLPYDKASSVAQTFRNLASGAESLTSAFWDSYNQGANVRKNVTTYTPSGILGGKR